MSQKFVEGDRAMTKLRAAEAVVAHRLGESFGLSRLRERTEEDSSLPLRAGATHLVFGEGSPDAVLHFLCEAPGQA